MGDKHVIMAAAGLAAVADRAAGRGRIGNGLRHVGLAGVVAVAQRSLQGSVRRQVRNSRAEAAPPAAERPETDLTCPPVSIRAGASTYAVAAPGKQPVGNDLRFQATITRTARECDYNGGEITARIGIQGRVIAGPAGAPSDRRDPAARRGGAGRRAGKDDRHQSLPDHGDRWRRTAACRSRWSPRIWSIRRRRRGRRFLHLLHRLRSAGAEAGAEAESAAKKK